MKHLIPTASFCLAALLAAQARAQEGTSPTPPNSASPTPTPETAPQAIPDLIQQLGSDSFRARLDAERALQRQGKAALEALQKASTEAKDPEVQWRAQRLVRQIERGTDSGLRQREPQPAAPRSDAPLDPFGDPRSGSGMGRTRGGLPGLDGRFEDLFRQLERDFQIDIPQRRFFQDDFFQDLRAQLDQMRKVGGAGAGQSNSMSMQSGPEGVRVEIKSRNDQGGEDVKVYEAPDLEAFKTKYPGVLEQNGLGLGQAGEFRWGIGTPFGGGGRATLPFGRVRSVLPDAEPAPADAVEPVPPPESQRLGVSVRELTPEVRQFLELPEGQGLQVEAVQPDTLAARLGLRSGDVLVRIAGVGIGGIPDVAKAVGSVEAGQQVEVVINRKGRERTLSAAKTAAQAPAPAAEPQSKEPQSKESQSGKLEKRR